MSRAYSIATEISRAQQAESPVEHRYLRHNEVAQRTHGLVDPVPVSRLLTRELDLRPTLTM